MTHFILPWLTNYKLELIENLVIKTKIKINIIRGKVPSHKAMNLVSDSKYVSISDSSFKSYINFILDNKRQSIFMLHLSNVSTVLFFLISTVLKGDVHVWESGYVAHGKFKFLILKFKVFLMNRADNIFFYSSSGKALYESYGLKTSSVIVNNTVKSLAKLDDISNKILIKKENSFLYVGGVSKLKSIDILLQALSIYNNKNDFNVRLNIVGPILDDEKVYFLDKFKKIKNVKYYGSLYGNDLKKVWLENNCFILPGIGGLAVNEALSYGLPAITTEGDGTISDFITVGYNGFLIDGSVESILNGIEWYVKMDLEQKRQIIHNCFDTYNISLKYDSMIHKFIKKLT